MPPVTNYLFKGVRVIMIALMSLVALAVIFIAVVCITEYANDSKAHNTKPGLTVNQVKEKWGQPNGIYSENRGQLELYYDRGFITTTYEFVFKDSILIEKIMLRV
jgi:hypothetical protein